MEHDTQKALKIFYDLRKDLLKSEDTIKLKHLNQLISLLESSFFNKIVVLHQSLDALKRQKILQPEDIQFDEDTCAIRAEVKRASLKNETELSPLSKDDFDTRVKLLVGDREMLHIQINKTSSNQTLGFSIKCSVSMQSSGVFVEDVTKDGLADKCGIKAQYQIVAIDGIPLDKPDSNRDVAVKALKSSHSRIDLYLARDAYNNQLSPIRDVGHLRNRSDMMFSKELDTEWTQYEVIELTSVDGTFGFGIMGGLTSDVMVRTVLSGGAAGMDGRLCINDHIMYINEKPVRNLSSNHVAEILKSAGDKVWLIVARPFDQRNNTTNSGRVQMVETTNLDARLQMIVAQLYPDLSTEKKLLELYNDVDPECRKKCQDEEEDYAEFIIVNLQSFGSHSGLSVVIANGEDVFQPGTLNGVFIKEVFVGSAAHKSGVQKYDRILKINDVPVHNRETEDGIHKVLNTSESICLHLQRYVNGPTFSSLMTSHLFSSRMSLSEDKKNSLEKMRTMKIHSSSESSDGSSVSDIDDNEGHLFVTSPSIEERENLIKAWKRALGDNYDIKIAEFSKYTEDGGLGISLEGTVDVDECGLEIHPHHYVRSIVENGPAARSGLLREKDELLEANGVRLYGVNHLDAVNILKRLPTSVVLVCARRTENTTQYYGYSHDDMSYEADMICQDLDDIVALETGSRSMHSIKSKSQDDLNEWPREEVRLNESTSRSRSLDQVHGLAIWDREITYVNLEKRSNGLGFSILDYQDPVNPQQSVIVIRSLVPNGAAAKDERIFPGDRLMSVNETDVSRATMTEAVEVLKRTEPGLVRLGIVKALCLDDNKSKEASSEPHDVIIDEELEDPFTELDQQSPDLNMTEHFYNVSSPQLYEDDCGVDPIPEALERKIRVNKLSGQSLGIKLDSETGSLNNENGFRIAVIESGSPAQRCGQLSIGDFVTKIDESSLRNIDDDEVTVILRKVTSCAGNIRLSFIPAEDYDIFDQSRAMKVNFR